MCLGVVVGCISLRKLGAHVQADLAQNPSRLMNGTNDVDRDQARASRRSALCLRDTGTWLPSCISTISSRLS